MSRHYRYRLPPWARYCLCTVERCTLPILIFQLIRTLIIPTSFDLLLLGLLFLLFFSFYLEWI